MCFVIIRGVKKNVVLLLAAWAALSAFARTALVWDSPEWVVLPENARAEAGALDFKSGD